MKSPKFFRTSKKRLKMNLNSYARAFWSLLLLVCVSGDITREDNFFKGEFSNNHKGRMLRVLMVFNNLSLDKCVVKCIQHNRCKTVNYNFVKEKCELTDVDFNDDEADKISYDWYNIGTPPKVNGEWGLWRNVTRCSAKCEGGTMNQARDCDSPEPQHGGDDCVGKGERTIDCNTHPCPVNGQWGAWTSTSAPSCSVMCGGGSMNETRECDSPKPKHGGDDCVGDGKRTISCNSQACPVHGQWGKWHIISRCDEPCDGKTFFKRRACDSPAPNYNGDPCAGLEDVSIPCFKEDCTVVNVAWKKPARSSSAVNQPSQGNDGDLDTYIMTTTELSPWWRVDLQADVNIEYFILRARKAWFNAGRFTNLVVRGKSSTNPDFQLCIDLGAPTALVTKFSCDHPANFREIEIALKSYNSRLMFNELEVYVKQV